MDIGEHFYDFNFVIRSTDVYPLDLSTSIDKPTTQVRVACVCVRVAYKSKGKEEKEISKIVERENAN